MSIARAARFRAAVALRFGVGVGIGIWTRTGIALWLCAGLGALAGLSASGASAATIEGRVVHVERPDDAAGLLVSLLGVRREGEAIERTGRTGSDGRFRFEDVSTQAAYLIGAEYAGITFPGGSVLFDPNDPAGEAQVRKVQVNIYDRADDASSLALEAVRWLVDREAGVYRVELIASLRNSSNRVAVAPEGADPLLELGVADERGDIEAPFGALPNGVEVSGERIALRGPVFPGERTYRFAYDMLEPSDVLDVAVPLPTAADRVEILVRDFGAAVSADGLHPARPIRDGSDVYQRYIGFDLPAGANLRLRVDPLPPLSSGSASRAGLGVLVALLAGSLCYFVVRPVTGVGSGAGGKRTDDARETNAAAESDELARLEREALIVGLHDLEHDFETGKISAEDRDRLRAEMRREALRALAEASRTREPSTQTPAQGDGAAGVPPLCSCGHQPHVDERFCAGCGKPL